MPYLPAELGLCVSNYHLLCPGRYSQAKLSRWLQALVCVRVHVRVCLPVSDKAAAPFRECSVAGGGSRDDPQSSGWFLSAASGFLIQRHRLPASMAIHMRSPSDPPPPPPPPTHIHTHTCHYLSAAEKAAEIDRQRGAAGVDLFTDAERLTVRLCCRDKLCIYRCWS